MEWMIMPLKRYADFSGRSRRKEYWMFFLFQLLALIPLFVIAFVVGDLSQDASGSGGEAGGMLLVVLVLIYVAVLFIPNLAVQVRRFHDQDKSGWMVLLGFIPYVGGLIVFIFMCMEGTMGPNRYGPDPKNPYDEDVFA